MGVIRKQISIEWIENKICFYENARDMILKKMKNISGLEKDDYYDKMAGQSKSEYYQGVIDALKMILRY